MMSKKCRSFFNGHVHHVSDGFVVVEHLKCLRIVTFPAAIFAGHVCARQEIHLQLDHTLTFARLAPATFGIERETASPVAAHSGGGQLGVKVPTLVEYLDVGPRRRSRSFADWRLIHFVDRFYFPGAAD